MHLNQYIILRDVEGDPPILYHKKKNFLVIVSKDLMHVLKLVKKGLTLDEIISELHLSKEEIEDLDATLLKLKDLGLINVY